MAPSTAHCYACYEQNMKTKVTHDQSCYRLQLEIEPQGTCLRTSVMSQAKERVQSEYIVASAMVYLQSEYIVASAMVYLQSEYIVVIPRTLASGDANFETFLLIVWIRLAT